MCRQRLNSLKFLSQSYPGPGCRRFLGKPSIGTTDSSIGASSSNPCFSCRSGLLIAFLYFCVINISMVSYPTFIHYACIAKGNTILAQRGSKESNIEELAAKCIEQAPPNHSMFSHTVKKRSYTFLIDEAFVYFAIFDENLVKSEALGFLDRIKHAWDTILKGRPAKDSDEFLPLCFQDEFDPIFGELMDSNSLSEKPLLGENKHDRNPSLGSVNEQKTVMVALLEQSSQGLMKKKRVGSEGDGIDGKDAATDNKLDVFEDRDFSLSMPIDRHKAKQIWKKYVWAALLLDIFVCSMLFLIWLWVCRGFNCMRS